MDVRVRAPAAGTLGISVSITDHHRFYIKSIQDDSALIGRVAIGDEITHVNQTLVTGMTRESFHQLYRDASASARDKQPMVHVLFRIKSNNSETITSTFSKAADPGVIKSRYEKNKHKNERQEQPIPIPIPIPATNTNSKGAKKRKRQKRAAYRRNAALKKKKRGSPAFDESKYSNQQLYQAWDKSLQVCDRMKTREEARLNEIANRLFQSDDDDEDDANDEDDDEDDDESEHESKSTYASGDRFKIKHEEQNVAIGSGSGGMKMEQPKLFDGIHPSFDKRLKELQEFKNEFGHCFLCRTSTTHKSLGRWCTGVRRLHSKMKNDTLVISDTALSRKQLSQLEEIGFVWKQTSVWSKRKLSVPLPVPGPGPVRVPPPKLEHQADKNKNSGKESTKVATASAMKKESVQKSYECRFCFKAFSGKTVLTYHLSNKVCQKNSICPHCSKSFSKSGRLEYHLSNKVCQKNSICPHCSKYFSKSGMLEYHLSNKVCQKNICPHCSKSYSIPGLEYHLSNKVCQKNNSKRNNICPHCSKSYSITGLEYHLLNKVCQK
jgi:hypothetical protein